MLVAVLAAAEAGATNLISNGDFSSGNTGFTSQYSYNTLNSGPELVEGAYSVVTKASDVHFAWGSYFDHTTGNSSGKYFVANASSDITKTVWQSSAISVSQPNTAYRFEAWLTAIYQFESNPPVLSFQIGDGTNWTNLGQTAAIGATSPGSWLFTYADGQFSSAGTYYVRLKNSNGATGGNDLGLDDIYFGLRSTAPSVGSTPGTTPTLFNPVAVPEPSTYAMALAGIACGGYSMWRRRKRHAVRAAASLASADRHATIDEITNTPPRVGTLLATLHVGLVLLFGGLGLSADAQAGTIAFWPGNGNANDSVGGHDGTLVNGAGFAAGQFGQQAFSLNSGSSQYISVPDSPAWDFGSNPFSIAMLVNFTSISGGGLVAEPTH